MNDQQILYQIPDSGPPISRARLATVLWIVVETMIFAGMLSAFVITWKSAATWPPSYETARAEIVSPPTRVRAGSWTGRLEPSESVPSIRSRRSAGSRMGCSVGRASPT